MGVSHFSEFGKNFCDHETRIEKTDSRLCSDFMFAVLEGYSLDRDASGLTGMSDTDLQKQINIWSQNPKEAPSCVFSK